MKKNKIKMLTLSLVAAVLLAMGQSLQAHTRLNIPALAEGTRIINHSVISHSCNAQARTIGTSIVFPDGVDSIILVGDQPHNGPLTDFLTNYGNGHQLLMDRSVFDFSDEKFDSNGNVVGFWAGGGPGMPNHLNSAVPFRHTAASIEPSSCAKNVKISVSIVDICEITGVNDFGEGIVELWTHNNLGTPFDRVSESDNGPAFYMITRNLTTNPLPASCGEGVDIEVRPSAAQLNRDMPIKFNGEQIWPQ